MGHLIGEPPLTANDSASKWTLGAKRTDEKAGKVYRYIKADTTIALGYVVGIKSGSASGWVVTPDVSKVAGTVIRKAAGVGIGAITSGSHGWIQTRGLNEYANTDLGVGAGHALVFDADLIFDSMAADEEYAVSGFATKDDSGSVVSVILECP